jgi:hypothetical protein
MEKRHSGVTRTILSDNFNPMIPQSNEAPARAALLNLRND